MIYVLNLFTIYNFKTETDCYTLLISIYMFPFTEKMTAMTEKTRSKEKSNPSSNTYDLK